MNFHKLNYISDQSVLFIFIEIPVNSIAMRYELLYITHTHTHTYMYIHMQGVFKKI